MAWCTSRHGKDHWGNLIQIAGPDTSSNAAKQEKTVSKSPYEVHISTGAANLSPEVFDLASVALIEKLHIRPDADPPGRRLGMYPLAEDRNSASEWRDPHPFCWTRCLASASGSECRPR